VLISSFESVTDLRWYRSILHFVIIDKWKLSYISACMCNFNESFKFKNDDCSLEIIVQGTQQVFFSCENRWRYGVHSEKKFDRTTFSAKKNAPNALKRNYISPSPAHLSWLSRQKPFADLTSYLPYYWLIIKKISVANKEDLWYDSRRDLTLIKI
jgi:hypothetical protein